MEDQENMFENATELPRSSILDVKQRRTTISPKNSPKNSPKKSPGLKDTVNKELGFTRLEKLVERKSPSRSIIINQVKSEISVYKEDDEGVVEKKKALETKKKNNKQSQIKKKDDDVAVTSKHTPEHDETIQHLKQEIKTKTESIRLKENEKKSLVQSIGETKQRIQEYKQRVEEEQKQVNDLREQLEDLETNNNELDEMIASLDKKGSLFNEKHQEKQQLIDDLLNALSETNYEISEIKGEAY